MMILKEKGNFPKTLIKVFSKNVNPNGKLSEFCTWQSQSLEPIEPFELLESIFL
jgi:hypothetical protein